MKIYYCYNCEIVDPHNIFEEICSTCGEIKNGEEIKRVEYSDVDNLIINQNIYNMIFGEQNAQNRFF